MECQRYQVYDQSGLNDRINYDRTHRSGLPVGCCTFTPVHLMVAQTCRSCDVGRCLCGAASCHGFLGGHQGAGDDYWQDADGEYYLVRLLLPHTIMCQYLYILLDHVHLPQCSQEGWWWPPEQSSPGAVYHQPMPEAWMHIGSHARV